MSDSGLVLHTKFSAYLGWSQPFIHRLLHGLEAEVPGAVLCNRREHRDRFPVPRYACVNSQALIRPAGAALVSEVVRQAWWPRLLHAHFGWSGVRSLLIRQCLGVPLVTTFGGRDLGVDLHDPLQRPLYEYLFQASDLCICVSQALAGVLSAAGVEDARIRVVHRGADADFFREEAREDRDADGPLRLLMVGRLVEKKGHADAIAALERLEAKGQRAVLRIVGTGAATGVIESETERRGLVGKVEVLPPTDATGVRDHFAWADALVHCSRHGADGDVEGIPNVVVEAAATGLPVVGTYHGGIPEVVVDGETGRLVNEGDVDALTGVLLEWVAQPERRRLGAAGARRVRDHFTLASQLDAHFAIYEALRQAPPRALPLQPSFTADALRALAPAVDADLLVASRWAAGHWVEGPAAAYCEEAPSEGGREQVSAPTALPSPIPLRERVRQLGAAWAERRWLGAPMRGYRALRRAWIAAAQAREDVRGWEALSSGWRVETSGAGAREAIRRVLIEGPRGDS